MNPGKIVAGLVDKWVVGRENDVLGLDHMIEGMQRLRLHTNDARLLVDGQLGGERFQELQRVELRLIVKADRADRGNRQLTDGASEAGRPRLFAASASSLSGSMPNVEYK